MAKKKTQPKTRKEPKKRAYPNPSMLTPGMLVSDLTKMKNPGEYMTLILFIALPTPYRARITESGATTQEELAKEFGVAMSTLSEWKSRPGFWEDVKNIQFKWFQEDIGDVILAQKVEALKGSTPAAKLVLETIGYLKKEEKDNEVPQLLAEAIKNMSKILDT